MPRLPFLFFFLSFATLIGSLRSDPKWPYYEPPSIFIHGEVPRLCAQHRNTCYRLCHENVAKNSCNTDDLSWTCTCADGPTPNITQFVDTIPYAQCEEYVAHCVTVEDNPRSQSKCNETPCPSKDPDKFLSNHPATTPSPSGPPGASATVSSSSVIAADSGGRAGRIGAPAQNGEEVPAALPTDSSDTAVKPQPPDEKPQGSSAGTVAGGVVGGIAGLTLVTAGLYLFLVKRKRSMRRAESDNEDVDGTPEKLDANGDVSSADSGDPYELPAPRGQEVYAGDARYSLPELPMNNGRSELLDNDPRYSVVEAPEKRLW